MLLKKKKAKNDLMVEYWNMKLKNISFLFYMCMACLSINVLFTK